VVYRDVAELRIMERLPSSLVIIVNVRISHSIVLGASLLDWSKPFNTAVITGLSSQEHNI
jgi:hypothetical protein